MAQAGSAADHPFIVALPPETDYFSYLTIVEANLNKASLPLLNRLLQDERLATNIGWDLVHLLAPLLPESGKCLDTVARLGNPREVILKVNELLEIIGLDFAGEEEFNDSSEGDNYDEGALAKNITGHQGTNVEQQHRILRFKHLLHMIAVLHPRIKTKSPSRFLMTTAEAVSGAYGQLPASALLEKEEAEAEDMAAGQGNAGEDVRFHQCHLCGRSATDAVISLLADLSNIVRPPLPPRAGSASSVPARPSNVAVDPEAEAVDPSEGASQQRILICLASRISETLNTRVRERLPAMRMHWTERFVQHRGTGLALRQVGPPPDPGVERLVSRSQALTKRLGTTLGSRYGLKVEKLLDLIKGADTYALDLRASGEFQVSDQGILFLYANALSTESSGTPSFTKADHRLIVARYLGNSSTLDFEPASLATVDAILFLGWYAIANDSGTAPVDGEAEKVSQTSFNEYLQQLSVVSANCPFPSVRYQAHCLVTTILQQTTSDGLKMGFIQDTLEFCPFPNLKVTAVGWLKDGILAASETQSVGDAPKGKVDEFGRPGTLDNVAVSLFDADDAEGSAEDVAATLPYWMAALNFLYMICCNDRIRDSLEVAATVTRFGIKTRFVEPLGALASRMVDVGKGGGKVQHALSEASLLADAVSRASEGIAALGL